MRVVTRRMMPAMAGPAQALLRDRASSGALPRRDSGTAATLDPVQQKVLELQRDAGNAAVTQLVTRPDGSTNESVPEDPASIEQAKGLFLQGAAAYDQGQYAKAYDFFTRASELAPRANLQFSRAQALRRMGAHREEALALYKEYLATGDGKRDADANAGIKELDTPPSTGDLELDVAAAKTIFDRGAALYAKGDFAHAYDEFTRAGELADRPGILFSRAQALRRLGGHREEAIELYRAYLDTKHGVRDKDATDAINQLSTPESTGDLDKDIEVSKSIFDKGAKLYDAGDFAHAYDEFTRAGELTDRPGILFSRAQALRRLGGRREEAIGLFQQYLDTGHPNRVADATRYLEELRTKGSAQ
jgi:tetratricopeptide (TPR) repeat protein